MIAVDNRAKAGKWALVILPLITVLREGMEAVVFVGGVSLGQPATSIPLAAIIGIICGLIVGYIIYVFASRTSQSLFHTYFPYSLLTLFNSSDYLPYRHDQLDPSHRLWPVQQVDWELPGVQVQQAVRLSSRSVYHGVLGINYRTFLFPRLGADADDAAGSGPGSYDVRGNVWHLNCCNPESKLDGQGWMVFSAIFGWSNNGSLGQSESP